MQTNTKNSQLAPIFWSVPHEVAVFLQDTNGEFLCGPAADHTLRGGPP